MRILLHFLLASLVLSGSVGVTLSRHLCGGVVQSIALFSEADKCYKEQQQPLTACPSHDHTGKETGIRKKGCCNDDELVLQLDVQQQTDTSPLVPVQLATVPDFPTLLVTYLGPHPRPRKNTNFENYRPPPRLLDAPRAYQVFRL